MPIYFILLISTLSFAGDLESRVADLEKTVKVLSTQVVDLEAEKDRLKSQLTDLKGLYPINDQHDTLSMSKNDATSDVTANQLDAEAHRKVLEAYEDGYKKGAISEQNLLDAVNQVSIDQAAEKALASRLHSIQTKLASLEALQRSDLLAFAIADRDTNYDQLQWYVYEVEKARLADENADQKYDAYHKIYLKGSGTWRADLELKLAADKAKEVWTNWQHKRDEQNKQFLAAEEALKKLK